jgi:hypothetical protein
MPHATTRYWTVPLTLLLFVNTVLIALAARHVGLAGEPAQALADAALANTALPEAPAEPPASDAVDPLTPATDEPPAAIIIPPPEYATHESAAAEYATPEYSTTEDWPTAEVPTAPPVIEPPISLVETNQAGSPPQAPQGPEIPRDTLFVINPPATGGVVHFLLDGEVVSLAPGELARVLAKGPRLIQYHRGNDFGNEELRAETGVLAFAVGDRGWTLAQAEESTAARLLQICRPVAPVTISTPETAENQDDF